MAGLSALPWPGDAMKALGMTTAGVQLAVSSQGAVPVRAKEYAREKILSLVSLAPQPVLSGRIRIIRTPHRPDGNHVIVEAMLDVNGRPIRAQVAASGSQEAIDLVQDRLRRKLSRLGKHPARHGARARSHRPGYAVVPPTERDVVRHKAYEPAFSTAEQAAFDMELMDYDFQLFTDAETGLDSIVYRDGSAVYGLANVVGQPSLSLAAAVGTLDATDIAFVFFADITTGRGNVLYRRHDGNYGLITPAQ